MKVVLVFCACAFVANAAELMSGASTLKNGLTVRYKSMLEPPLRESQILMLEGGHSASSNRIHRTLHEKNTGVYYGYDLVVDPAGPRRFRISIEPLTRLPQGRLLPLPKYPPPQTVEEGDIIALDLLVSRDGVQKLVDYIEVEQTAEPGMAPALAPRDFTFDDGAPSLQFRFPTSVYVNGRKAQDGFAFTVRQGATIWFAVPGQGRYILSLAPRDGFRKSGAIRAHVLTFEAGTDTYEIRSAGPILGAGKAWNLYVLHDPKYQPKSAVQPAIHGGIDRLETLMRGDDPVADAMGQLMRGLERRQQETKK